MSKLIGSIDFGKLLKSRKTNFVNVIDYYYEYTEKRDNYDYFLSQHLNIGMFIPAKLVDGEWVVLEEPKNYKEWINKRLNTPYDLDLSKYEEFQQAKERVIFEGFCKKHNAIVNPNGGYLDVTRLKGMRIETIIGSNLELTEKQSKKLGL